MNDVSNPAATAASQTSGKEHLPLNGITVLDLTLARAGPTCVRHLADWGANIIRIEPPEAAERGPDRPARGLRLPEPASQQAHDPAESQVARGPRRVHAARRESRRHRREHARGGEAPAQGLVRRRAQGESAHRLRQHQRLRPDRALRQARRRRPDRAGHGRAHVDHRAARARARCASGCRSRT